MKLRALSLFLRLTGAILARFDALRKKMSIPPPVRNTLGVYIRLVSTYFAKSRCLLTLCTDQLLATIYTLTFAPLALATVPLRLLHPTLRKLGWRNNYLPIDTSVLILSAWRVS